MQKPRMGQRYQICAGRLNVENAQIKLAQAASNAIRKDTFRPRRAAKAVKQEMPRKAPICWRIPPMDFNRVFSSSVMAFWSKARSLSFRSGVSGAFIVWGLSNFSPGSETRPRKLAYFRLSFSSSARSAAAWAPAVLAARMVSIFGRVWCSIVGMAESINSGV